MYLLRNPGFKKFFTIGKSCERGKFVEENLSPVLTKYRVPTSYTISSDIRSFSHYYPRKSIKRKLFPDETFTPVAKKIKAEDNSFANDNFTGYLNDISTDISFNDSFFAKKSQFYDCSEEKSKSFTNDTFGDTDNTSRNVSECSIEFCNDSSTEVPVSEDNLTQDNLTLGDILTESSFEKSFSDIDYDFTETDLKRTDGNSTPSSGSEPQNSPKFETAPKKTPPPRRPLRKSASMKVNRRSQRIPQIETSNPRTRTSSISVQDSEVARHLAKASLGPISGCPPESGHDKLGPPSPGKEGIFRRSFRRAKSHISRISHHHSNQQVHHPGNKVAVVKVTPQDHFLFVADEDEVDEGDLI